MTPASAHLDAPDVEFQHVDKRYRLYKQRYRSLKEIVFKRRLGEWEDHWALRDVSFTVKRGSTFGLIGPNGAGKSTSLKMMAGILVPDAGEVVVRRRLAGLLELGAGFQPEYSGRENIFLNASLMGLSRRDIEARFDAIVAFSGLQEYIDQPLLTYSSGMHMRLAFAVATHVDAEVLLVDEILAVGDEAFQRKCFDWLDAFRASGGTIVLVSHNLAVVREICDEVVWIDNGNLRDIGHPNAVVGAYLDHVHRGGGSLEEVLSTEGARAKARPQVQLGEFRVLDVTGALAGRVATGSTITLEVDFTVQKPLGTPVFGVAIFNSEGACVYATNNSEDGVPLGTLETDGTLRVEYRDLALLPGRYRVTVSVFSAPRSDTLIDSLPLLDAFEVDTATREAGVVRLPHSWSVTSRSGIAG